MARTTKDKTQVKPITVPGSVIEAAQKKADRDHRGNFSQAMTAMAEKVLREEGFLPELETQAQKSRIDLRRTGFPDVTTT